MKILFVDHAYHSKTASSKFFINILERFFDVSVFLVEPSNQDGTLDLQDMGDYDVAVLWQMDFLAPYFIARGVQTVVIPMYDGSGPMPDLHWLWSRRAKFVNFSRRLHERVKGLGGESLLVRYYPEPSAIEPPPEIYDGLRVFLWQRRPEHGINLSKVESLFGDQLRSVHIHNATDDPSVEGTAYITRDQRYDYQLTVSNWFPSREHYLDAVRRSNCFIAPRRSEGIGMGFLEAMALGIVVCAHDDGTHDEYIHNGVNGILFNADIQQAITIDELRLGDMRRMSIRSVEEGRKNWLRSELQIVDYIKRGATLPPEVAAAGSTDFLRGLVESYYAGIETYQRFLFRNRALGSQLAGVSLDEVLNDRLEYEPSGHAKGTLSKLKPANSYMPWLHENRLRSSEIASGAFTLTGAAEMLDNAAWIVGSKLVLGFRIDIRTAGIRKMQIRLARRSATNCQYCVIFNDALLVSGRLAGQPLIEVDIPDRAARIDSELHLQFEPFSAGEEVANAGVGIMDIVFS